MSDKDPVTHDDLETDFMRGLDRIIEQTMEYVRKLLPREGISDEERLIRRVGMSGGRYIRLIEMDAPEFLIEKEREMLEERLTALVDFRLGLFFDEALRSVLTGEGLTDEKENGVEA